MGPASLRGTLSLGEDSPLLQTFRCSRSCSSFTFCTWASSVAEIRSTWCLGREGGEVKGPSNSDWRFMLPRWEDSGMERPGIPRLGLYPLAEQEES